MRKGILALLGVAAMSFAVVPNVMAGAAGANNYDIIETNHSQYGAFTWHATMNSDYSGGDSSWGYTTGMDALEPGQVGVTEEPLMPPAYTDPCPEFATDASGIDMATAGGCPIAASGNPADPQTAATGVDQLATILDDMLAKMYDTANPANSLTQQLDILFATNWSGNASSAINGSTTTGAGLYIDQTLDQDLVFNTGNITSYVGKAGSAGDGVINRLTQLFELDTNQAGPNGGNTEAAGQTACNTGEASCGNTYNQEPGFGHAQDADYIDQWVVGYAKDVASDGNGIVSSISSWFEMGTATNCGARCSHTYDAGHQAVVKAVEEIDAHPGN